VRDGPCDSNAVRRPSREASVLQTAVEQRFPIRSTGAAPAQDELHVLVFIHPGSARSRSPRPSQYPPFQLNRLRSCTHSLLSNKRPQANQISPAPANTTIAQAIGRQALGPALLTPSSAYLSVGRSGVVMSSPLPFSAWQAPRIRDIAPGFPADHSRTADTGPRPGGQMSWRRRCDVAHHAGRTAEMSANDHQGRITTLSAYSPGFAVSTNLMNP
jgi:hypothetical protein